MSDIKRACLIPLGASKDDDKKCRKVGKTVRISFVLRESNEDTCPEFNYKEQLAVAKRKDKIKSLPKLTTNGLDPFNDDDDDVRRIAQEMEAKYGGSDIKRKRKGKKDDYADIGMGYDESDSFIDNTDGYDEMIPQNVTTLHGGFYINCGALEFKADNEASSEVSSNSSDEGGNEPTRSRKRILDSSSESEGEKETEEDVQVEKKPKLLTNGTGDNPGPKLLKNSYAQPNKERHFKKKKTEERAQIHTDSNSTVEKKDDDLGNSTKETVNLPSPIIITNNEVGDSTKENEKQHSNISDIIESVVRGVDDRLHKLDDAPTKDVITRVLSDGENNSNDAKNEAEFVKLPENLPSDIVDIIDRIKNLAHQNTESKIKFLSGPVCSVLLSLERKCKCLGKQSRMKIYEHLAPHIKCRKETLIRKAKNLVLEDDRKRIEVLQFKLKQQIDKQMITLFEDYEREAKKFVERKFSKEYQSSERNKQLRMPKRRFTWTEEIKRNLKEMVSLQKRCFLLEEKNKVNLDALMIMYLKTEIKRLWPDGWMSLASLQKVCSSVLSVDGKKPVKVTSRVVRNAPSATSNTTINDLHKLTTNSSIMITPISLATSKPANCNIDVTKPKTLNKSDITINRIESKEININRINKASLPEDGKTPSKLTITPVNSLSKASPDRVDKTDLVQPLDNVTMGTIDLSSKKSSSPELKPTNKRDVGKMKVDAVHEEGKVTSSDHCQIIDLTEVIPDNKKIIIMKPKAKFYETDANPRNKVPEILKPVENENLSGNAVLSQLIEESLCDSNTKVPQNFVKHTKTLSEGNTKHYGTQLGYGSGVLPVVEHQKLKLSNEGDDIQKVMEGLKELQKMSSPVKVGEPPTSSPVSVIAYNKNYTQKNLSQSLPATQRQSSSPVQYSKGEFSKSDFSTGFQEVFQRQLYLNNIAMMQNQVNQVSVSAASTTSSKNHYNSSDNKYVHGASFLNDKFYQTTSNNSFAHQQSSSQSENLQQTANHIQKPQQK